MRAESLLFRVRVLRVKGVTGPDRRGSLKHAHPGHSVPAPEESATYMGGLLPHGDGAVAAVTAPLRTEQGGHGCSHA